MDRIIDINKMEEMFNSDMHCFRRWTENVYPLTLIPNYKGFVLTQVDDLCYYYPYLREFKAQIIEHLALRVLWEDVIPYGQSASTTTEIQAPYLTPRCLFTKGK